MIDLHTLINVEHRCYCLSTCTVVYTAVIDGSIRAVKSEAILSEENETTWFNKL